MPNVTVRDVTERPETVECGSNILASADSAWMLRSVRLATSERHEWNPPAEYLAPLVAETVCRIVTGFHVPDPAEREWSEHLRR